jgi:hypothetical protein
MLNDLHSNTAAGVLKHVVQVTSASAGPGTMRTKNSHDRRPGRKNSPVSLVEMGVSGGIAQASGEVASVCQTPTP